ncbi:hypothetical protein GCM10009347_30820 [Shewanella algicola]|uniref:Uncharacterized protein n=1 Tax=Shewanella algicola TaxID=640633 RepID=A0A9X2CEU7_9GAMM|nr:hypothetical protein [Shewanella algicola]MCL1106766.1 hypothetical protein [Shewanella algicola]GGP62563.1 hypothetical protein GCM10009347_30820 [Shewanella algicola]
MNTLFKPTLIALACFSTMAMSAEMSVSTSTSAQADVQFSQDQSTHMSVSANQRLISA